MVMPGLLPRPIKSEEPRVNSLKAPQVIQSAARPQTTFSILHPALFLCTHGHLSPSPFLTPNAQGCLSTPRPISSPKSRCYLLDIHKPFERSMSQTSLGNIFDHALVKTVGSVYPKCAYFLKVYTLITMLICYAHF